MFGDLREFIEKAKELGECRLIEGADWDLEIGLINEWQASTPDSPLLLFDRIKDYEAGYRVASNLFTTPKRTALALDLPLELTGLELVKAWREKMKGEVKLLPPVEVKDAPVKENIHTGDEVDLFEFPTPKWHKLDGGRYIGTGNMVITRDPDEGWVNLGTYRVQIHDKNIATIYMSPGRHADIMRRKYWERGQSCPVVVTCGQEPVLWGVASFPIPWGICEYDYTGGFRNKAVEITKGVTTDLPIPATAEIALEGEIAPPETETRIEGPFGEWTGYYGVGARPEAAFRVKSILHRNNPIIMGAPPSRFMPRFTLGKHFQKAAITWDELDKNVPGVKGVWWIEDAAAHSIAVVSIEQKYDGHAKQAASVVAGCNASGYMLRWIIVVDEDIDPTNISEVLWALGTRCDPETATDFIRGCWGSPIDPALPPDKKGRGQFDHSTGVILACKPYHWIKQFPPAIKFNPEVLEKTKNKWEKQLKS